MNEPIDSIADFRTWTFAEDEGGATCVTISDTHLTVERTSGPDCDGTRTQAYYVFVQRDPNGEHADGVHVRTGRYQGDPIEVHADNPQRAYDDFVDRELGGLIRSRPLTGQIDYQSS